MKLLLFSDVHCNLGQVSSIAARADGYDVIVGAGDFAVKRQGLQETIDALRSIDKPTVLVPGNGESDEELREACAGWPAAHVLHGNGVEIDGVSFFGLGGGIPETPFGSWSFDIAESRAAEILADCPSGGVLVVHSPPQGLADLDGNGKRWGSTAILDVVKEKRPQLVVCGHIHHSWTSVERQGETTVINAGPAGMEFEL